MAVNLPHTQNLESIEPEEKVFRVGPNGHPLLQEHVQKSTWSQAFFRSISEGLWALAETIELPDDTARFWRLFGTLYLTELAERQNLPSPAERIEMPITDDALLNIVSKKPLCEGAEYISIDSLRALWSEMNLELRKIIETQNCSTANWLERRGGSFSLLKKICLHLAENKRSESHPFAFLATIAVKVTEDGRVLYSPLGRALEEAEAAGDHDRILEMLLPLVEAAKVLPWLSASLETKEIYGAQVWTSNQAHVFLKSLVTLSSYGLRSRVPNWWTTQSSQVRAKVIVDTVPGSQIGAASMLQFDVALAIGDETLTPQEIKDILSRSDRFVSFKGKWIEIDKEKLQQTLDHWKKAALEVKKNGLTWHQGMRLLSGADGLGNTSGKLKLDDGQGSPAWTEVIAGAGIDQLLTKMRVPDASKDFHPGKHLKASLRPYQEKGVAWLGLLTGIGLGACLADDMGLGKTMQVISLLLCRQAQAESGKPRHTTLLIAPASLLANWFAECAKFAPSLVVFIDHSSFKNKGVETQADLLITTYGTVARSEKYQKKTWDLLVLDEAQAIKTPHALQTKAVKSLQSKARIALTGTPIENRLMDLWSLFDFLNPGLLATQENFRSFANPKGQEPRLAPLRTLTQPYILRRLKTDRSIINDLPDKTETLAWCNLSKQQVVLYSKTVQEFEKVLKTSDGIGRRGIVLSYLMRFKQICNHPAQALNTGDFEPSASGKYLRLQEIAEEIAARQEKLIIFTQYREMCPVLARWLRGVFGREGLILDGSTAINKRRALVESFQSENGPPFFVLSLKAGGTGLTLTAANHVVHFDRWWNPAVENQATDRAFRIGQKRNVLVHKFVCRGTLEEKIDQMIQSKKSLSNSVLGTGDEVLLTELSNAALLKLVSLDLTSMTAESDA